jgi:hypothetical protein
MAMEWSTPTVRLSIRIKKSNTEPTLYDYRTPTPKQKLKKVSFGSVDIVKFVAMLEESPKMYRSLCGIHSPIPIITKARAQRRFSI